MKLYFYLLENLPKILHSCAVENVLNEGRLFVTLPTKVKRNNLITPTNLTTRK